MARRGRPRKAQAKRRQTTRAGRGMLDVAVTDEHLARKAALLRLPYETPDERSILLAQDASSPVAVLFARGELRVCGDKPDSPKYPPRELLEAAHVYSWLYWRQIGSPHARIGGYRDVAAGSVRAAYEIEPDNAAALERLFNRMSAALDMLGRDAARAAKSLIVDQHWPSDGADVQDFPRSRWPLALMVYGLAALVDYRRAKKFSLCRRFSH